jgi:hypothetical protein
VITNYGRSPQHRDVPPTPAVTRGHLIEAVAIAATHYRHLLACYTERQAELAAAGVALADLVTRTWEEFEAVAAAEQRLFAAVDALDEVGGLAVVPRRE